MADLVPQERERIFPAVQDHVPATTFYSHAEILPYLRPGLRSRLSGVCLSGDTLVPWRIIPRLRLLLVTALVAGIVSACAGPRTSVASVPVQSGNVPSDPQLGYGNTQMHAWWPLTSAEIEALKGLKRAKQGEWRALLALAILASDEGRDPKSYKHYEQHVDRFLAKIKPLMIAQADEWHRGYELNRAMHREFFHHADNDFELDNYVANQAQITRIFTEGRYNCLSSALLYVVLARAFDLPVRIAVLPTHVFVEMARAHGGAIEIETTSPTGFDWVHDMSFYQEREAAWASSRGLQKSTFEDYQRRTFLAPYQLVARALMREDAGNSGAELSRHYEIASMIDTEDPRLQRARVDAYALLAEEFVSKKDWNMIIKLYDIVGPALTEIAATHTDSNTLNSAAWMSFYHAKALMETGRDAEALVVLGAGLGSIDSGWSDAADLRTNYASLLTKRMADCVKNGAAEECLLIFRTNRIACLTNQMCADIAGILFRNLSAEFSDQGNWPGARKVLQECLTELPADGKCRDRLVTLEAKHRF